MFSRHALSSAPRGSDGRRYDQTEIPYRQLIVDIVQATFAATYRTGDWPRRFRSHAAKEIAAAMADRLATGGRSADGATATAILHQASSWENVARPMADVVTEFRSLVDDELAFPQPELDTLASAISDPGADDEGGGEDDDVR